MLRRPQVTDVSTATAKCSVRERMQGIYYDDGHHLCSRSQVTAEQRAPSIAGATRLLSALRRHIVGERHICGSCFSLCSVRLVPCMSSKRRSA